MSAARDPADPVRLKTVRALAVSSLIAACAALVLLPGCAQRTMPGAVSAAALVQAPAQWSTASASSITGSTTTATDQAPSPVPLAWWLRFDDTLLTRLVNEALAHNPGVESARAALRQAWALQQVAAAALLPSAGAGASAQRSQQGQQGALNSVQAELSLQWVPDVFGGNRAGADAGRYAALASAASLADVRLGVAATVALAYTSLRSGQARLAIAADNLTSQQATLQIARWRQQAGLVTEIEVEQARAQTGQTAALLPVLQTGIAQNRHAIALLTGAAPAALDALLLADGPLPQWSADPALELPADTLRQRADVHAAEQQLRAAQARVTQAEAARWPGFSLGGSLGLAATSLPALRAGSALLSSVLASVSLPLFDGGARRATVDAQQAAFEQALQAYRNTLLGALRDVEDTLVALLSDRERLARLRQAADAAAHAATLARQRFASGLIDFQTVLETQRSQLATQDAVASASADITADQVRLFKALGGGWRVDTAADAVANASDQDARAVPPGRNP